MRVLVSGGAGFIGSNLVLRLASSGIDVTILDNLSPQVHGDDASQSPTYRLVQGRADFVRGDVRNRADWKAALAGVTHVVHLAAETGTGQSMYRVAHYCDVNVQGTGVLLDLLAEERGDVQRLVAASSRAIYGEGSGSCPTHGLVHPRSRKDRDLAVGDFAAKCPLCDRATEPVPTHEDAPPKPTSVYAITKLAQESLVLETCNALGIDVVALRFQNVYGPGQSLVNPYTGILSIFSSAMFAGRRIDIFEDGLESRDFVYIDDVVEAIVRALDCEDCGTVPINVGSGRRSNVIDVVEALGRAYARPIDYEITGNYRLGDIRHHFADTSRAHALLGFRAAWRLDDGIQQFCDWASAAAGASATSSPYEGALSEARALGILKHGRGGGRP